jgi:hypothetical protein
VQGQPAQLLSGAAQAGRVELAAALLRSTGRLRLAVAGSSMLPAIRPRDVLMIRACPRASARAGDVAVFVRGGRLFAHRVVSVDASGPVTRGDAVRTPDAPVEADEWLGRVVKVVRRGRAFRPGVQPAPVARVAAHLFSRCARAGRLFTRLDGLAWSLAR